MFNPVKVKCDYLDSLAFQMSFWCCEIEQISQSQDEFLKADKEETRNRRALQTTFTQYMLAYELRNLCQKEVS